MRVVAVLILLAACAGSRPAVIPKLSELPADPERRDAVLDSAHTEPTPEQRPTSKKARKAETYAATAAAVIGWFMSDSENVTLGGSIDIDESGLVPQDQPKKKRENEEEKTAAPPVEKSDEPLVPWIRLK